MTLSGEQLQRHARDIAASLEDVTQGRPFTPHLDVSKVYDKVFLILIDADPDLQIVDPEGRPAPWRWPGADREPERADAGGRTRARRGRFGPGRCRHDRGHGRHQVPTDSGLLTSAIGRRQGWRRRAPRPATGQPRGTPPSATAHDASDRLAATLRPAATYFFRGR